MEKGGGKQEKQDQHQPKAAAWEQGPHKHHQGPEKKERAVEWTPNTGYLYHVRMSARICGLFHLKPQRWQEELPLCPGPHEMDNWPKNEKSCNQKSGNFIVAAGIWKATAVPPFHTLFYHLCPAGIRERRATFPGTRTLLPILILSSMPLISTTEALPEVHLAQSR